MFHVETWTAAVEPSPRFQPRRGRLAEVLGGTGLMLAWAVLWSAFLVAVTPEAKAFHPARVPAALAVGAFEPARIGPPAPSDQDPGARVGPAPVTAAAAPAP